MDDRLEDGGDFALGQFLLGDVEQIDNRPRMAVLEHDPQIVVLEVRPVVFDDVLVLAQAQDLDLLLD